MFRTLDKWRYYFKKCLFHWFLSKEVRIVIGACAPSLVIIWKKKYIPYFFPRGKLQTVLLPYLYTPLTILVLWGILMFNLQNIEHKFILTCNWWEDYDILSRNITLDQHASSWYHRPFVTLKCFYSIDFNGEPSSARCLYWSRMKVISFCNEIFFRQISKQLSFSSGTSTATWRWRHPICCSKAVHFNPR